MSHTHCFWEGFSLGAGKKWVTLTFLLGNTGGIMEQLSGLPGCKM